jgi:hypothetical protein
LRLELSESQKRCQSCKWPRFMLFWHPAHHFPTVRYLIDRKHLSQFCPSQDIDNLESWGSAGWWSTISQTASVTKITYFSKTSASNCPAVLPTQKPSHRRCQPSRLEQRPSSQSGQSAGLAVTWCALRPRAPAKYGDLADAVRGQTRRSRLSICRERVGLKPLCPKAEAG